MKQSAHQPPSWKQDWPPSFKTILWLMSPSFLGHLVDPPCGVRVGQCSREERWGHAHADLVQGCSALMAPLSPPPVCACVLSHVSCVHLFVTPWTVAQQGPLSTEFHRQEYWNVFPCPPPGDFPNPRIESESPAPPALQVYSLPLSHRGSPTPHIHNQSMT